MLVAVGFEVSVGSYVKVLVEFRAVLPVWSSAGRGKIASLPVMPQSNKTTMGDHLRSRPIAGM